MTDIAWLSIPHSLPKRTIDDIDELVNYGVMEKSNNEIRFSLKLLEYYDRVDVDYIKKMVTNQMKNDNQDRIDDVVESTIMADALKTYLNSKSIHVDDNDEGVFELALTANSLKTLIDTANKLKSIFDSENKK